MDSLSSVIAISASGLRSQSERLRVVSENIANAGSTASSSDQDPYRRKVISFGTTVDEVTGAAIVEVSEITRDTSDFSVRYDPSHPAADSDGFVKYPNVNPLIEISNMREASRSYEANMSMMENARQMQQQLIDLLR